VLPIVNLLRLIFEDFFNPFWPLDFVLADFQLHIFEETEFFHEKLFGPQLLG
jgi:hypothetical protein